MKKTYFLFALVFLAFLIGVLAGYLINASDRINAKNKITDFLKLVTVKMPSSAIGEFTVIQYINNGKWQISSFPNDSSKPDEYTMQSVEKTAAQAQTVMILSEDSKQAMEVSSEKRAFLIALKAVASFLNTDKFYIVMRKNVDAFIQIRIHQVSLTPIPYWIIDFYDADCMMWKLYPKTY